MSPYIAESFAALLKLNQLGTFEQLWNVQADWFEPPNQERGGWSGISRIVLQGENGKAQTVFLKRQQGHSRRTLQHPFSGESTFAREFRMIQHLAAHQVSTLVPIYFGTRMVGGQHQSILMTAALDDYADLDAITNALLLKKMLLSPSQKRSLIKSVAVLVRKMHDARVQHRALYPKHLFVRCNDGSFDASVIDLEKSRFNYVPIWRMIADLATLASRLQYWRATDKMLFYNHYLGTNKLDFYARIAARWIMYRAVKKQNSRSH